MQPAGLENAVDPAVVRRPGPRSRSYAAELLEEEALELDDFESADEDEEDEEDDEDEVDSDEEDDEVDVAGFEAGELLDEEPRLSLR